MPYSSSHRRIYVAVFAALGLLISFHYIGWLRPVEQIFYRIFTPASSEVHTLSIKIGDRYEYFKNKDDFLQRYAAYSLEIQQKQVIESQNKLLMDENAELKKQLNYVQKQSFKTALTEVVGREVAGAAKIIIIRAGSEQGVKVGQPVMSSEGIMIGKIIRVEKSVAMVRLITDTSSKVEASIIAMNKTIGVIEGGYGISLRMKFVPRSEVVKVDDQIITSGYEPMIPRGLLLGKVAEVENEASQGFQNISVVSLVDLNKLTMVSVLLTK